MKRSRGRAGGVALSALLLATTLAACGAMQPPYEDLRREATTADELPPLPDYAWENNAADLDSARYVGEYEGTRLWLMESPDGICLLAYPDAEGWITGCGGELTTSGPGGTFLVLRDDALVPEGAEPVSANVFAVDG